MIQKFSTRRPSLENKMKILKEIASANNIALHFEEDAPANTEVRVLVFTHNMYRQLIFTF